MANYSELLKHPKWQKKRLEILSRDKFMCQSCCDNESELHVHHKSYKYGVDIWDYDNDNLITFCVNCHKEVTALKKEIKESIDLYFVHDEPLSILNDIIGMLSCLTPDALSEINDLIRKNYFQ